MKFKVKVGVLLDAVNKVSATVDKKKDTGTGSIFVAVYKSDKGQAVYLYSTNVIAESTVKLDAEVEEAGRTLLDPAKLTAGLLNRNPGDTAEISLIQASEGKAGVKKPARLQVKIGRDKFHLGYDPNGTDLMAKRMEAMPFKHGGHYKVSGKDLTEFVRRASFCIPNEKEAVDSRVLAGMRLVSTDRGYEAHATDGFALARVVIKGEKGNRESATTLVPQSALIPLCRLVKKEDDVIVIEGDKNDRGAISKLFFKIGANTYFGTSLLAGTLPDISRVIDMHKPDYWFKVNRSAFAQALDRAVPFDDQHHIQMEILGSTLKLSARTKGQSEDITQELAIELEEGVPENVNVNVTVNLTYIKNAAQSSTQEFLRLGVNDWSDKVKKAKGLVVDDAQDAVDSRYVIQPIYM